MFSLVILAFTAVTAAVCTAAVAALRSYVGDLLYGGER